MKCYCCDTDLCNGAGTVGKNLLLLLVPLASIFVTQRFVHCYTEMSVKMSSLIMMLLLATMLATADALQCHVCNRKDCFPSPITCPPGTDSCIKAVHVTGAVLKACVPKTFCDEEEPNMKRYCCDTDLCNGAGTVGKNLLLLLVPLASIFVLS
ncbi:ly-6/neurotoxin-like protein 1 [Engraulis encrasicolus]|uniref:ly-6/neurotoxin-like protein 1 n=1 Tax=Engraulis encrasicolus TaxID=184585 RepID=UPI002FD4B5D0